MHETKGTQTEDRVYEYSFMKPHDVKTLILDGEGKGSGGVWVGGDQVSGHLGGILSGIHLKIDLHDPRAVSLRMIFKTPRATAVQRSGPKRAELPRTGQEPNYRETLIVSDVSVVGRFGQDRRTTTSNPAGIVGTALRLVRARH